MNVDDLSRFLGESLADRKLSGSEKSALSDWLAKNVRSAQTRGLARHVAFQIARDSIADPAAVESIDWLEDVLRVIVPNQTEEAAPLEAIHGQDLVFFSPGEDCLQHISQRLRGCRRTAELCVFTITDDRITRSILDAHHRGVKVRILSDIEKAGDLGSDMQQFRESGIVVKLADVRGPNDPNLVGHMHHKFAILDGTRLINGSYNWTRGAASTNFENIVDTSDATLISAFSAEFERLWNLF